MSTTTDINKTIEFVKGTTCCIFEIRLPRGLRHFNFNDSEREVLLEPGLKLVNLHYRGKYQGYSVFTSEVTKISPSNSRKIQKENYEKEMAIKEKKSFINTYRKDIEANLMKEIDEELERELAELEALDH